MEADGAVVEALARQARACRALGSPLYGELLGALIADVADAGRALTPFFDTGNADRFDTDAVVLRLLGAVHRVVLTGDAPDLAQFYPSAGGTWDAPAGTAAFVDTMRSHRDRLVEGMAIAPQTNEVGRSSILFGAVLHLVDQRPLPIRVFEIGASGGLNLRFDQYRYVGTDGRIDGAADSMVVLDPAWRGVMPPQRSFEVVERAGCDVSPIDPCDPEGATRLASFVWPDQTARCERLRAAIEIAGRVPAAVATIDAAPFVDDLRPEPGRWTVLWHSIMWQYLNDEQQEQTARAIERLGARAGADAPVAHVRFETEWLTEPTDRGFLQEHVVRVRTWPKGKARRLATAAPHGLPTVWVV